MDLKEFIRQLVETEDTMERMSLVEANKELLETSGNSGQAQDGENWKQKYEELKKKYIETFFGGSQEQNQEQDQEQDQKSEEETKAETIKIDDVLKGGN